MFERKIAVLKENMGFSRDLGHYGAQTGWVPWIVTMAILTLLLLEEIKARKYTGKTLKFWLKPEQKAYMEEDVGDLSIKASSDCQFTIISSRELSKNFSSTPFNQHTHLFEKVLANPLLLTVKGDDVFLEIKLKKEGAITVLESEKTKQKTILNLIFLALFIGLLLGGISLTVNPPL